jgi:formate-dependent nitrite reductase cytochrome c552 subunit
MPVGLLDISISRTKAKPAPKGAHVRRVFEDGALEVQFSNGVRVRQQPLVCLACSQKHISYGFNPEGGRQVSSGLCRTCFDKERLEWEQAREREREERLLRLETSGSRRYTAQVLATPLWRDRFEISKIYKEAQRLTVETGIKHHVDHIYPIQSIYGCGLHVHYNLQILKKSENLSKKNKFPLFDSPALRQ